ncbi:DUF305 domain-containing protein [Streptomyces sp. MUM 203J]|uniref:DUF305 domain-containing protein n=1 Tax=Streptomyces sp. MUM 203J TaxID=2791990 RepID=UPI0035ABD71C
MTRSRHRSEPVRPAPLPVALAAALALTGVFVLSACDPGTAGSGGKPQATAGAEVGVLAPGRPGEPARTLSPEEAATAVPEDAPNAADVSYTTMMIVHHEQALRMTALVPDRVRSEQVRALAARIEAAQGPEIAAMRAWLKTSRGEEGHGGGRHGEQHDDHSGMPGMATEEQLAKLERSRGEAFDDLFLKLMITHHEGAVTMASEVLGEGRNIRVQEMANDVIAQQTAEIHRMRGM